MKCVSIFSTSLSLFHYLLLTYSLPLPPFSSLKSTIYYPVSKIQCTAFFITITTTNSPCMCVYVCVCVPKFPCMMTKGEWQCCGFRELAFVISFPFPSFHSPVPCCWLAPLSSTWTHTRTQTWHTCVKKHIQLHTQKQVEWYFAGASRGYSQKQSKLQSMPLNTV